MISKQRADRLLFHALTFVSMGVQLQEWVAHERLKEVRTGEAASWGDCPDGRYLVRAWQGFKGILEDLDLPAPWMDEMNSELVKLHHELDYTVSMEARAIKDAEKRASAACSARKATEERVNVALTDYQKQIHAICRMYVTLPDLREAVERLAKTMDSDLAAIVFNDTSDIQF